MLVLTVLCVDVLLLRVGQKTMVFSEEELSILSKVCNNSVV